AMRSTGDEHYLIRNREEMDNIRAAFEWAMSRKQADAALTLSNELMSWQLMDRGDAVDAVAMGQRALALSGGTLRLRVIVLATVVFSQMEAGDFDGVNATGDEVLAALPGLDDTDPDDLKAHIYGLRMTAFSVRHGYRLPELREQAFALASAADDQHNLAMLASM